jgi:tetratricopeptide (TPR) repeat protein
MECLARASTEPYHGPRLIFMRRVSLAAIVLVLAACHRGSQSENAAPAALPKPADTQAAEAAPPVPRDVHKAQQPADHVEPLKPCPAGEGDPLAAAATYYDAHQYDDALACAAQAAAALPRSADAQSERGAALSALGRYEDARFAYAKALALEPDHADALLGAADLYITRLAPSRDANELGFEYAKRGRANARKQHNAELIGQFALLEAMALNGLGRNREALERADEALSHMSDTDGEALYEKASALYELCRFDEARKEFTKLLSFPAPRNAYAHYHLGLLHERDGQQARADAEFAQARQLSPEEFPPEIEVPPEEFKKIVDDAVKSLAEDERRDLAGVPITTQDIPDLEDLVASDPPLSPAILGLFRGPSQGEPCPSQEEEPGPCRAVVLYRKNLIRVATDKDEFVRQTRVTLVHELGHLRGEDDVQLAARGLE